MQGHCGFGDAHLAVIGQAVFVGGQAHKQLTAVMRQTGTEFAGIRFATLDLDVHRNTTAGQLVRKFRSRNRARSANQGYRQDGY